MAKRRYMNRGSAGLSHGSLAVKEMTDVNFKQAVAFYFRVPGYAGSESVILDAEQVDDLIKHLRKICPCSLTESNPKIVDEL